MALLDDTMLHEILINDDDEDDENDDLTATIIWERVSRSMQERQAEGNRVRRNTPAASQRCYERLLALPDLGFYNLFRMKKAVFFQLCRWLRLNTEAEGSREQPLGQKLLVFLWICAFDAPQRMTASKFHITQSSVSRIFHELIDPMRQLHKEFVQLPNPQYLSPQVELVGKFKGFSGAIGAIDGTHIAAHVPVKLQARFWSRKNKISQNVLAAVTFDGLFSYVLAGAEGSIHDARLLPQALTRSFTIPEGRYYLADAGFGTRKGIVIPYHGPRYHLNEAAGQRPRNSKELYNLRHSQLRTVVERVFGQCKRKWKIIRNSAPEYQFVDQIRIVYAVTGLFNFIKLEGRLPSQKHQLDEDLLTEREQDILFQARQSAESVVRRLNGNELRDHITAITWEAYRGHLDENRGRNGVEIDEEEEVANREIS